MSRGWLVWFWIILVIVLATAALTNPPLERIFT
jgi:hypothetical protein